MNSFNIELQDITDLDIANLSDDELLEVYKMVKQYVESLEQEIQRVSEDDW